MFNTITIVPNELSFPTDVGFLAENLLYYDKVILIAVPETFPTIYRKCGIESLFELLQRGNLKILAKENLLGTMSRKMDNGNIINDVCLISSEKLKTEQIIFDGLFKATGRQGFSKRTTSKLLDFVEPIKYENNICDFIRNDLDDETFVKQSIIDALQFYNPELILSPADIHYEKIKTDKGFFFLTNLNYEAINKRIPNNENGKKISSTGFILNIQEARGDMHLASALNSEIASTPIQTHLMKLKFRDIYQKSQKSSENLFQFNDFVLDSGHAIREAINSGEKSMNDFLTVLEKAEKFREWLRKVDDDKNIVKEYHKAVTKETWVDKLPSKGLRWAIFTGAGVAIDAAGAGGIGTALGVGLSAGDAFLLDKLLKGWKPNIFIEGELKKFVEKSEK